MNIEIDNYRGNYRITLWDLPGSPPYGFGRTRFEALCNLFRRLLSEKNVNWMSYIDFTTLEIEDKTIPEGEEKKVKGGEFNCKCQICSNPIKVMLMVSDKIWKKINVENIDYMCASCMIKRIEQIKVGYCYDLFQVFRPGSYDLENDFEDDPFELHKCDKKHELVYFRGIRCPMCNLLEKKV